MIETMLNNEKFILFCKTNLITKDIFEKKLLKYIKNDLETWCDYCEEKLGELSGDEFDEDTYSELKSDCMQIFLNDEIYDYQEYLNDKEKFELFYISKYLEMLLSKDDEFKKCMSSLY